MDRRLRLEKAWLLARMNVDGFSLGPVSVYHRGVRLQQQTVVEAMRAALLSLKESKVEVDTTRRLVVVFVSRVGVDQIDGFAGFTGGLWELGYTVQSLSDGWQERLRSALLALWKNKVVEPARGLFDGV